MAARTNADFDQYGRFTVGNSAWRGKKSALVLTLLTKTCASDDRAML
jgi:hypothetical protein